MIRGDLPGRLVPETSRALQDCPGHLSALAAAAGAGPLRIMRASRTLRNWRAPSTPAPTPPADSHVVNQPTVDSHPADRHRPAGTRFRHATRIASGSLSHLPCAGWRAAAAQTTPIPASEASVLLHAVCAGSQSLTDDRLERILGSNDWATRYARGPIEVAVLAGRKRLPFESNLSAWRERSIARRVDAGEVRE